MVLIGLVGPFGSGCSYVAKLLQDEENLTYLSLSNVLREKFKEQYPDEEPTREKLQDFGNELRESNFAGYLAEEICKIIDESPDCDYVIDSIRNPEEAAVFRRHYPHFFLFGVFASKDVRWNRVLTKYRDNHFDFEKDDKRDSGEKIEHGQRVTDTFRQADIVIINNEDFTKGNEAYKNFLCLLKEKIDIIKGDIPFRPTPHETYMAMAYAASMRSSCLKRKVGATIVDAQGNVFSSGYNEVPKTQKTCLQEYNNCYRSTLKQTFHDALQGCEIPEESKTTILSAFNKFKNLDYCRALHAEENAILNVARVGASSALSGSTLYTTTYPCNLCANKIAQVGIKSVVYFEPYPMEEAKRILERENIKQIPFEGVTYQGYFRLMEVVY